MNRFKVFLFSASFLFAISTLTVPAGAVTTLTPDGIKFDSEFYALHNPEVVRDYGNTFEGLYRHYLEHGRAEGRKTYAETENENVTITSSASATGNTTATEKTSLPTGIESINPDRGTIFVGDSRTYLMRNVIGDDTANWLGYPGTKYDTLISTAVPIIDNVNLNGKKIVILYGINDITAYGAQKTFDNYNIFLATKAQEWIKKGATVYFASLAGMKTDVKGGISAAMAATVNPQVTAFNNMIGGFPSNIHKIYINYGDDPFSDGLHYNTKTCVSVYNQIQKCL